jgi:hypothetical protein
MAQKHNNSSYYADMLGKVREQIVAEALSLIEKLGGNICVSYYHSEVGLDRYTFFETDDDGYGRELFIESITTNPEGEVEFCLSDSEDCYSPTWDISNFTATESLYLLYELEAIAGYVEESGEKVVTDYPDYED